MVAAIHTGLSYASLASRYPRAAGAAFVTNHAYGVPYLSYLIGLLVTASGLTSMATSTNVFANTLQSLIGGPWIVLVLGFLGFMTAVNFYGLKQSMWTNLICTAVEVGGLIFIVAIGAKYWGTIDYFETPPIVDAEGQARDGGLGISLLLSGAVLTFFSFIGFEDMLNVAEEVKEPERTMPWGIVIALAMATVLYIAVAVTAVSVVDYRELAAAPAPLSAICDRAAPWLPARTFDYITMFAVANTVLINYIMGSRMLYGMARQGLLPAVLGRIHGKRNTPHVAIVTLLVLVLILAFAGGQDAVKQLATSTALLLLFSFMVVNSALVVLKLRPGEPHGRFEVPLFIPICGILVNAALIASRLTSGEGGMRAPIISGCIVAVATALYFVLRPKNITDEALAALEE
jgi:amino acid transporter